MSSSEHGTNALVCIFNWVFGVVAPAAWWFSANIDLINKYMEFALKGVSMMSFSVLIIINRKKAVSELKCLFTKCNDDDKLK